jgi:hypothetical protein
MSSSHFVNQVGKSLGFMAFGALMYRWAQSPCECYMSTKDMLEELWRRHLHIAMTLAVYLVLVHLYFVFRLGRWFFRVTKKYVEVVHHDAATVVGSVNPVYEPERYVEGSDYIPDKLPDFFVQIYGCFRPGVWTKLGCGWRLADQLITANHVIPSDDIPVRIKHGDNYLDVSNVHDKFEQRGTDLSVMLLGQGDWTKLQVRSAKVPKMALSGRVVVRAYCDGMSSCGIVKPYVSAPYLIYEGSTQPGFSGTPLYVHNTVIGMHVGAGKVNYALDANWIKAVSFKPEDSEDWLFGEIERVAKRGKTVKFTAYNPDEGVILMGGKYHTFDMSSIPDHLRDALEYASAVEKYDGEGVTLSYDDSESLNLRRASVVAEARRLRKGETAQNQSSVEVLVPSGSKTDQVVESMNGPESILAQLSKVLEGISTSPKPRELERSRPRSRKQRRSLSKSLQV